MSDIKTLLGVDFGLKNIGVAIGQTLTKTASPLNTILFKSPMNWREFDQYINQWSPSKIILGWPLDNNGKEQKVNSHIKAFKEQLTQRYKLPVELCDESYSSMLAQDNFATARSLGIAKKKNAKNLDSHAAKFILQRWMDLNL